MVEIIFHKEKRREWFLIDSYLMNISKIFFAVVVGIFCSNLRASDPALTEQDLIYSNEQMLDFSVEAYLITFAPHLISHAESISHWAGFSSISPKILIALMEYKSSVISVESSEGMSRPFGELSGKDGFNEQLKDISNQLAELHYAHRNDSNEPFSVVKLLSANSSFQSISGRKMSELSASFSSTYYHLFPYETP